MSKNQDNPPVISEPNQQGETKAVVTPLSKELESRGMEFIGMDLSNKSDISAHGLEKGGHFAGKIELS